MTEQQHALAARVRGLLVDETPLREGVMFGTRSFMVRDKLIACALRDGGLLIRVPAVRHDELVGRAGAAQAEMGAGRSMGPGWLTVAADVISGDDELRFWLEAGLEHNRAVTIEIV